jgi:hypothetical protein
MRRRVKRLNDAVIGQTVEGILDVARGSPRDLNQPSRQQSATGSGIHRGKVISVSGKSAACCRTFSIFASPETLGATQSGYRCEENQRAPGLSSTEICKLKKISL